MKHNFDESVERYLLGEMNEQEEQEFRSLVQSDVQLQKKLRQHLELIQAIQQQGNDEDVLLLGKLQATNKEEIKNVATKRIKPKHHFHKMLMWLPASIAAILVITVSLKVHFEHQLCNTLYTQYYISYTDDEDTLRGAVSSSFYVAMQQWEEGNQKNAIAELEGSIEKGDVDPYYQDAMWNLALFYLKTHKKKKAIQLLRQIQTEDGFYAEKSQSILRELE